ncbi:MAG: hypothetical protein H6P99_2190 [Holophagaceae bacterium]|nr:hypothetical protein [Holophagaceae bacterium]
MMPELTPAQAASIHATQRKLVVGVVLATLMSFAVVILDLAHGGRSDPSTLRAEATLLNGAWRFRTGDAPGWAAPEADDSGWETIDMTAPPGSHDGDVGLPDYVGGWMAHGHPGYHGFAWYRRMVTVPAGPTSWDILGPTLVEDGYELYWNGQRLGGSGRLDQDPRVVGTRPLQFRLPADAAGTRGLLAVRVFALPGSAPGADGGGMHSAPILAPRPIAEALHRVQWERTIAGYIVEVIEPIAMFAVIGIALKFRSRSSHKGFLILASIALALMAIRRLNNAIVAWTDQMDLRTYSWLASWMWIPTVAFWTLAWNRWCARPWRSIDVSAILLAAVGITGTLAHAAGLTRASRLGSIALFIAITVRIAREGPNRILAIVATASITAALFGSELLDPVRLPGIWFPFGIGVSRTQYLYAIAVPLLAFLIVRTIQSGSESDQKSGTTR